MKHSVQVHINGKAGVFAAYEESNKPLALDKAVQECRQLMRSKIPGVVKVYALTDYGLGYTESGRQAIQIAEFNVAVGVAA